jgi:hypothetical protein
MTQTSRIAISVGTLVAMAVAAGRPALAESAAPAELTSIRKEMDSLRAAQSRRLEELQETESRLAALEAAVARLEGTTAAPTADASGGYPTPTVFRPAPEHPNPRLQLSGDVRVRYEANSSTEDTEQRNRGVIRARLRAGYTASDRLHVGAMLSTGDPANPRTGDVTLSDFGADVPIKFAQAYLMSHLGRLQLTAGKMPQPFQRTELVWDGDVNPQGIAAAYRAPVGPDESLRLTGLYFMVNESAAGPDSDMIGGQLAWGHSLSAHLKLELAAAYYDYRLRNAPGTSPAAFRGNLVGPDGGYLSDFELADGIAAVSYDGFAPQWPVRLQGDYVRNLGAAVPDDTGYELDLLVGRASKAGDWRFMYGYSEAGVDAVLGVFSTDNTDIPTNYVQHTLALDYMLAPNVSLNTTAYRYRPKNGLYAGLRDPKEWLNRVRLNLQVSF